MSGYANDARVTEPIRDHLAVAETLYRDLLMACPDPSLPSYDESQADLYRLNVTLRAVLGKAMEVIEMEPIRQQVASSGERPLTLAGAMSEGLRTGEATAARGLISTMVSTFRSASEKASRSDA